MNYKHFNLYNNKFGQTHRGKIVKDKLVTGCGKAIENQLHGKWLEAGEETITCKKCMRSSN